MKSVYDLKSAFSTLLTPLVKVCHRYGISPNAITTSALIGSLIVSMILCVFHDQPIFFLIVPVWMFIRMALNNIDGYYAREYHKTSSEGFVLNEVSDVISDVALWIPFLFYFSLSHIGYFYIVLILIFLSVLSEFVGVLGYKYDNRRYDGPFGKSDRALYLGLLSVLIVAKTPEFIGFILLFVAIILSLLTIIRRWLTIVRIGHTVNQGD